MMQIAYDCKKTSLTQLHKNQNTQIPTMQPNDTQLQDPLHNRTVTPTLPTPLYTTTCRAMYTPSTAKFHFRYGLNTAVLTNALLWNDTSILLFRKNNCSSSDDIRTSCGSSSIHDDLCDAAYVIPPQIRTRLDQSTSGFHTNHPESAGWIFLEQPLPYIYSKTYVPVDHNHQVPSDMTGLGLSPATKDTLKICSRHIGGTTIMMSPPFMRNIFHAAQVSLNLVHMALNLERYNFIREVTSIFLPTVDRTDSLWSFDLMTILVRFLSCHVAVNETFPSSSPSYSTSSVRARGIPVYMKEDVHSLLQSLDDDCTDVCTSPSLEECSHFDSACDDCHHHIRTDYGMRYNYSTMLIFEKIVVLGTMDLSTPFLMDRHEASLFRTFVRWYLHIGQSRNREDRVNSKHDENVLWSCPSYELLRDEIKEAGDQATGDISSHPPEPPLMTSTYHNEELYLQRKHEGRNPAWELHRGPNDGLRVTIVCRPSDRHILNLKQVLDMLEKTGVTDVHWLHSHVVHLDGLSLREQVVLMQNTDILISTHGAAMINLIFLEEHSAVIEIMTSPWYEPGYQPTAIAAGLYYYVLPQTNISYSSECAFPAECLSMPLLVVRRDLRCYGMRSCSVVVDVDALEVLVWQASQAVRIMKRNLVRFRQDRTRKCCEFNSIANKDLCGDECFYRKAYVQHLDQS